MNNKNIFYSENDLKKMKLVKQEVISFGFSSKSASCITVYSPEASAIAALIDPPLPRFTLFSKKEPL